VCTSKEEEKQAWWGLCPFLAEAKREWGGCTRRLNNYQSSSLSCLFLSFLVTSTARWSAGEVHSLAEPKAKASDEAGSIHGNIIIEIFDISIVFASFNLTHF
jgi:hypothetical protein